MTLRQAYNWAKKKWEYIVDNNGSDEGLYKKYPKLKKLPSGCAYCQMFIIEKHSCDECPIGLPIEDKCFRKFPACHLDKHPYNLWMEAPTKRRAKKILNLIITNKPK